MSYDIDRIFELLSWNNDEKTQERGIEAAKKIKHLSVFIMPKESKSVWLNCAKILSDKSDDELKIYFYDLFEWFKDMNWPGACLIYNRLKSVSISSENFFEAFEFNLSIAEKTDDYPWSEALHDFYIDYVMNLIDCDNSIETQNKGIELARDITKISVFFQPKGLEYNENVWENCAKVLSYKTDEELIPYLDKLFEWIKNLNLPGARCIFYRLQKYGKNVFYNSVLEHCIRAAKLLDDKTWVKNLNTLKNFF